MNSIQNPNNKQQIFITMFVGTLLYSVVLGFFNDYTEILTTTSYSTTFLLAIVMQLLTYGTFALKDVVKSHFNAKQSKYSSVGLIVGVWLVLFLSKFVFLAVIAVVFQDDVQISGFVGLMLIVITLTIAQIAFDYVYTKLGK